MDSADESSERLAAILRGHRTESIPPELHARLERDFADYVASAPTTGVAHPAPGLVARVRAVLTFDSLRNAGLAEARGATGLETRQLVLAAPGLEIALDLGARRAGRTMVRAQLFPLDDGVAEGVEVTVWDPTGLRSQALTGHDGDADLGELTSTLCVLEVGGAAGRWPIVDADLDLREES